MKRKTKKTKTRKVKKEVEKPQKPVKVKQLFKTKKISSRKVPMGKHFFNETLATDKQGEPLVTQSTWMQDDKVLKVVTYDLKNNVIISKDYE